MATQLADEGSILHWYRRLLALRRASPALRRGSFALVDDGAADVLAYTRTAQGERWLVVLAFATGEARLPSAAAGGRIEAATDARLEGRVLDPTSPSIAGPALLVRL